MSISIPYAVNGLGRVGRALLRAAQRFPELQLVAVNDLASPHVLARLVARDSLYGPFDGEIFADGDALVLNGRRVAVSQQSLPQAIPWHETGPRIVVEATGAERTGAFARRHLEGSVERVVTAWNTEKEPPDVDVVLCLGVNEHTFDARRHRVVSNASCTTNAIAPIVQALDEAWGVRRGLVNSIHSATQNQTLLDGAHGDARRSRSAFVNIIPTPSRAARAVGNVLPALAGRLDGFAVRVPTPQVALLDLVVHLKEPTTTAAVCDLFRSTAAQRWKGILAVSEEELVSSDYVADPHSATIDLSLVQVVDKKMLRVVAWYDNEWGYACRLVELLRLLGASPDPVLSPGEESSS